MNILGIDPGLGIIGFGLVQTDGPNRVQARQWGTVVTSKDKPDAARLQEIHQDLGDLLRTLAPDIAVVESIFFFKNAKTLVPVCQARGVILLTLQEAGIPYVEFTPMQVKLAISGYGKASKQEVQAMVKELLQLEKIPRPDDAADALALAVCQHHHTRGMP